MKIQEQDLFYGAALSQIISYLDNVSLRRVKSSVGHFVVNDEIHMIVKYRTNSRAPWRFTLSPNEVELLRNKISDKVPIFLVLICANVTICVLDTNEIHSTLDLYNDQEKWISVSKRHGSSLWVAGPKAELKYSIRHNDFPQKLFHVEAEAMDEIS